MQLWPLGFFFFASDWKEKQGSCSQKRACLHSFFFFFFWFGGFGLRRGLREIQRDSHYFSCQGENMRVVRLTNGRVSAAVESGKSLHRLMSLSLRDALGLLMDARFWLWLAATLASTHPPVPASGWTGATNTRGADVLASSAVFIRPDTEARAAAPAQGVWRRERGED